jgi:hypothetical protein
VRLPAPAVVRPDTEDTMKIALAVAAVTGLAIAAPAHANCRIKNETKWSFKVESGNVSNQSVGANTTTSIASGRIKAVDQKAAKTVSGSCKNGDRLKIIDDRGVPVLVAEK